MPPHAKLQAAIKRDKRNFYSGKILEVTAWAALEGIIQAIRQANQIASHVGWRMGQGHQTTFYAPLCCSA